MLELREATQTFTFELFGRCALKPVLSLLRDFSAPVRASVVGQTEEELAFLMANDADSFVRWDSAQTLATSVILGLVEDVAAGRALVLDDAFVSAARQTLAARHDGTDLNLMAYTLSLPTEGMLADTMADGTVDPGHIHSARDFVISELSRQLHDELLSTYKDCASGDTPYAYTGEAVGKRRLAGMALRYLCASGGEAAAGLALSQLEAADNMTDELTAFDTLLDCDGITEAQRTAVIDSFERKWQSDALVMDGWFGSQASVQQPGALAAVKKLMNHPQWTITNPNKVRALVGRFAMANLSQFHAADGSGYDFLADFVNELDPINPQAAARMTTALRTWRRLEPQRRGLAKSALERIRDREGVSPDTFEVASKTLADAIAEVVAEAEAAAEPQ